MLSACSPRINQQLLLWLLAILCKMLMNVNVTLCVYSKNMTGVKMLTIVGPQLNRQQRIITNLTRYEHKILGIRQHNTLLG